ncbi:Ribonucleotide-diphosphate reductase alpha subunit [Polymorphum gilvum SL003B-26A1]|uniref:Ribonucleotide-diphosphate reductase alpha subunit n=1 Tax=Polymorphum gilvum (strain LMG 25793 / CGMCC 1.9160 / SL003B-26A1) TaxID=991905 RepID=F2J370_POLGS|nr:Ribonucleotide-diphosphate reductase alpha subunit [Polymorphum gilvum SL003B-26A1]
MRVGTGAGGARTVRPGRADLRGRRGPGRGAQAGHPIVSKIEIRKEGKIGRVYYPAPFMTNDNLDYYRDAYEIGPEKIIDTYAAATRHVDQGLSLTLFFRDSATTRDINRAQIHAWKKGIKTIYYIRLRQMALEGTEVQGCVSCSL